MSTTNISGYIQILEKFLENSEVNFISHYRPILEILFTYDNERLIKTSKLISLKMKLFSRLFQNTENLYSVNTHINNILISKRAYTFELINCILTYHPDIKNLNISDESIYYVICQGKFDIVKLLLDKKIVDPSLITFTINSAIINRSIIKSSHDFNLKILSENSIKFFNLIEITVCEAQGCSDPSSFCNIVDILLEDGRVDPSDNFNFALNSSLKIPEIRKLLIRDKRVQEMEIYKIPFFISACEEMLEYKEEKILEEIIILEKQKKICSKIKQNNLFFDAVKNNNYAFVQDKLKDETFDPSFHNNKCIQVASAQKFEDIYTLLSDNKYVRNKYMKMYL